MKSLSFLTSGGDSSSMPHPVHGGSNAQEHPSLHGLRKLQTQGMVCAIIFGILLGTMMAYCECYWSAAAVGGLVLVNVIGLPILWLTEHIEFACAFAAHGTCVFLLAIGWTFGGGPHSAGTIALAYMVQIQHRLQVPSRASSWCIAGIFLCGLVLAILERTVDPQYLTPQRARLPPTWYAVVFWFGTNWPGVLLYVILSQVMEELAESRRLLEASKADADCLNAELLQQQHRLKMERSLAYGLIFNVFPRSVSASLIELFEQYSHDPEQLGTLHHTSKAEAHPMAGCDSLSSICLTPDASSCASRDDFPHSASRRLQALVGRSLAPQRRRAAVMFGDIVRFTETASRLDASTLVEYLDCFFGQVSGGDEGVRTGGSDNTGEGLASQPRRYRMPGQPLLNRHQVGGASRGPVGLTAQSTHRAPDPQQHRERHKQAHGPQRPAEGGTPTQHAKGRTGDRPGPRKDTSHRRNVPQGGGGERKCTFFALCCASGL